MKIKVRNNSAALQGVWHADGRLRWVKPGDEKRIEVASLAAAGVEGKRYLDVEVLSGLDAPPESLTEKVREWVAEPKSEDTFAGFLDRSIPLIAADLPGKTDAELQAILRDEKRGKSRKGLVSAIEAEIEARSE